MACIVLIKTFILLKRCWGSCLDLTKISSLNYCVFQLIRGHLPLVLVAKSGDGRQKEEEGYKQKPVNRQLKLHCLPSTTKLLISTYKQQEESQPVEITVCFAWSFQFLLSPYLSLSF
jgi:hypothetical protein